MSSKNKIDCKNTQCLDCNHIKGNCDCYCCCSISKIGCPSCIGAVLAYRGIRKLINKLKK